MSYAGRGTFNLVHEAPLGSYRVYGTSNTYKTIVKDANLSQRWSSLNVKM